MRLREYFALLIIIVSVLAWFSVCIQTILRGSPSHCPGCGTKRIRRSMRRSLDHFFPLFIRAFRCELCRSRFYALVSVSYVADARPRAVPRPSPRTELARS